MSTATSIQRQPISEFVILLIGAVLFVVARRFELDALLIVAIFMCIFAGLAALFTITLARRSLRTKLIATVAGLITAAFSAVWLMTHASSTEIFSPALVGYVGGGLALSGVINIVSRPKPVPGVERG